MFSSISLVVGGDDDDDDDDDDEEVDDDDEAVRLSKFGNTDAPLFRSPLPLSRATPPEETLYKFLKLQKLE